MRAKKDVLDIINKMEKGVLKDKLLACSEKPFSQTDFTIGHRGAKLKFPEHTKESYVAATLMGAGMVECDVTFTKDQELVCRHSPCDLHMTTNILSISALSEKCSEAFSVAEFNIDGSLLKPASAKCCTTDITLEEFKRLLGTTENQNIEAKTVEEYTKVDSELYPDIYIQKGTVLSHLESIRLFKSLGVKMIPQIKEAIVSMPFEGVFTQEDYVKKVVDEYKFLGVDSKNVFIQSSNLNDILYLISNEENFSKQSVYLYSNEESNASNFNLFYKKGIRYIASPIWKFLALDKNSNTIVPSKFATWASSAGLDLIAWTFMTPDSVMLASQGGGWYYQGLEDKVENEGDMINILDSLVNEVGIKYIFTDFPAITTTYANCMEE